MSNRVTTDLITKGLRVLNAQSQHAISLITEEFRTVKWIGEDEDEPCVTGVCGLSATAAALSLSETLLDPEVDIDDEVVLPYLASLGFSEPYCNGYMRGFDTRCTFDEFVISMRHDFPSFRDHEDPEFEMGYRDGHEHRALASDVV